MSQQSKKLIKNKEVLESMDYQLLRKEAIAYTQDISGDNWTDYNIHDPGVTILEQFCYALTDIAYRTNLSIETLLFHGGNREDVMHSNALFPPEKIFPSSPVTLTDYRILILDHFPNVISNCWIKRVTDHKEGIQNLFSITILLKDDSSSNHLEIKNAVKELFVSNRNLCEDIYEIKVLESEKIGLSAEIDVSQNTNVEDVLSSLLFDIESYFNPSVRFLSLEELERRGLSHDQIFDVPSFKHGFITPDQLPEKPQEFYVSKIADYILNADGVRGLRNLSVTQDGIPVYGDTISVSEDKYLTLDVLSEEGADRFDAFDIKLYKGGVRNNYVISSVLYALELKVAKQRRGYEIKTDNTTPKKSKINTKELISYESIQMSFPGIYGVGNYTPAKEEGSLRLAQSSQLKAYLMFFDQIMANHLMQLSKIAELFSIENADPSNIRSYFTKLLNDKIPGVSDLLKHRLPAKSALLKRKSELEEALPGSGESSELDRIEADIKDKDEIVSKLAREAYQHHISLSDKDIKASKKFKNREILDDLIEIKEFLRSVETQKEEALKQFFIEQIDQARENVEAKMMLEFEELEQEVQLQQHHLDEMMRDFDNSYERKNRLLTHLLGRFGEQFSTDFHIKFSSQMEGEIQENIDRKLIVLKSLFLKEITKVNKERSKGVNYLSPNALSDVIPLKRKVSLLLDLKPIPSKGLASSGLDKNLKIKKLSGLDIEKTTRDNFESRRTKNKSGKTTFLVQSPSHYAYLFKYGLKAANYTIKEIDQVYMVYFDPPTNETATELFVSDTRAEAKERIEKVIAFLRDQNSGSEGFHVVEHILLRPSDLLDCMFMLLGEDGQQIFKSKNANPEEVQKVGAQDTILLGCFKTNYKILKNPKQEFVVLIKNSVGVELAKSLKSFMTEVSAEKFIEESVAYFNLIREGGNFEKGYELDNQKKYFFDVLDESGERAFESLSALDISDQEVIVERLATYCINPECYKILSEEDGGYKAIITDYEQDDIVRSYSTFSDVERADSFKKDCLAYFEKILEARDYKSVFRFRRIDGRDARQFNSQLSIVYSGWSSRFNNQEFLQLFRQTLFNCIPAHLTVNMVGLQYDEMKKFENLYSRYMKELSTASLENRELLTDLSNDILNILLESKGTF